MRAQQHQFKTNHAFSHEYETTMREQRHHPFKMIHALSHAPMMRHTYYQASHGKEITIATKNLKNAGGWTVRVSYRCPDIGFNTEKKISVLNIKNRICVGVFNREYFLPIMIYEENVSLN